ncbi:glycoside hydrolase family 2 TIM barrel-domain containing protein [Gracilibacillus timonensis]|uniref:glycoside hydrolase family 2 TIM barrel-domain containing protein n=1 Tax=Gracilibacillus timonensis TaxID=1816696 RepID=UPI000826B6B8|nr:glycoside hydrolase family 2 TIM barrel-domain containing protein [Gracilibacillus timonensis]
MNQKQLFNDQWYFAKSDLGVVSDKELVYQPVDIPHDWQIYNTTNLYENSIGWYRKVYHVSKAEADQFLLYFDGVYMDSTLFVNGQWVGEWKYGYSAFEHDITAFLRDGENEIKMKVVFQSPNSRWYPGAGIYRNVWLKKRDRNYIETDGIYISTCKQQEAWQVEIETSLVMEEDAVLAHRLSDGEEWISYHQANLSMGYQTGKQSLRVKDPQLWSPAHPHLYQLETCLMVNGEIAEKVTQDIGFRSFSMDPDQGFFLNDRQLKLNGICEHHDLGALGSAFNREAVTRRLSLLKEMGVNAIRTAHNMPAKELMKLADEMGFLIVSEAFDMWERPKTPYDYARFFKEWSYKDVASWVKRDRNHPSLMMWSIGNEIYDTHADQRGQKITRQLMEYVQQFDPKQNGVVTIGSNYMAWENAQKCADIVKVAGYNYSEKYYHQHHQAHPDWVIYGSETASTAQSRGIYHFPFQASILADDDEQCSALGNSATSWGADSVESCILAERDALFSLGQFIWTGFDYIGEPTPYHTKNAYLGQIDTATFPKDSYYIYQAAWTDYREKPMIHIFPYWDFNQGQLIDVRVASNAPLIELEHNGKSLGTFSTNYQQGSQLTGWWQIPYEPGELKATAYNETGQIIATEVKRSFGDAQEIRLKPNKLSLTANATDLIFVEIGMDDQEGNPVENANNRVDVSVTGAGRLVGLDNGDSTDYDQYKGTSRRLFSGKLMAIIAATLKSGPIHLEVRSKGMANAALALQAEPATDEVIGVQALEENQATPILMGEKEEIPVRKLEIASKNGQQFDQDRHEIYFEVSLFPKNTFYRDVEWSLVTDTGIESKLAKIEADGHTAKVTALGDGEFRVRCTSKNGTDKVKLISELECSAQNLGKAYHNPYQFISAGFFDYSKGGVTNGNERGVATSRDGETQVGFHDIDFGATGADVITIPIFALTNDPYKLQIWEGVPGEKGSELLADVVYQKESKWNVYQSATYQLAKKLTGITSICVVLQQKVHIKGFVFEKINRAFQKNQAADCDHIYGDTFVMDEERVEQIGNNVSLVFDDFNFTQQGTSKLEINGHSPIDKNTIHVQFFDGEETSTQLIEFIQTDDYQTKTFDIDKISGVQQVTFLFLPGSNFNFGFFRFQT